MTPKKISVLGSTGSIGRSTLSVVRESSARLEVFGLSAGRNSDLLRDQIVEFSPRVVSCSRKEDAARLRADFPSLEVLDGIDGAAAIAGRAEPDIVVSAITGISGLRPTLAALHAGKRVALANKESMVVAGKLIRDTLKRNGGEIIPVDSEHSGVFQCLAGERRENVKRVILTASGGPFFKKDPDRLGDVSVEEALSHPRWEMGRKVTIDSATLMNKGLELIEARWLFDLEPFRLDMIIHPQSIVHSLVEMRDGSVIAQMSPTDMRIPIQYALTYPDRADNLLKELDLVKEGPLEFLPVEADRFPLAALARRVLEESESYSIAMNAANEVAVEAFLQRDIPFQDIAVVVTSAVDSHRPRSVQAVEDILDIDKETRRLTKIQLKQR